jgi:uncharacterized protein
MGGMIFEWDETKDIANQRKHGLSFQRASRMFADPLRVSKVERIEGGEVRWQTFGVIEDILLVMVAHVVWDSDLGAETIRIISARRATKQERRIYENEDG